MFLHNYRSYFLHRNFSSVFLNTRQGWVWNVVQFDPCITFLIVPKIQSDITFAFYRFLKSNFALISSLISSNEVLKWVSYTNGLYSEKKHFASLSHLTLGRSKNRRIVIKFDTLWFSNSCFSLTAVLNFFHEDLNQTFLCLKWSNKQIIFSYVFES